MQKQNISYRNTKRKNPSIIGGDNIGHLYWIQSHNESQPSRNARVFRPGCEKCSGQSESS